MNKKGFTLVELLAVIVILSLLMVVATSTIGSSLFNTKKKLMQVEAVKLKKQLENELKSKVVLGEILSVDGCNPSDQCQRIEGDYVLQYKYDSEGNVDDGIIVFSKDDTTKSYKLNSDGKLDDNKDGSGNAIPVYNYHIKAYAKSGEELGNNSRNLLGTIFKSHGPTILNNETYEVGGYVSPKGNYSTYCTFLANVNLKKDKTYTVSAEIIGNSNNIKSATITFGMLDKNNVSQVRNQNMLFSGVSLSTSTFKKGSGWIKLSEDVTKFSFCCYYYNHYLNIKKDSIQIEEGTTATEYRPPKFVDIIINNDTAHPNTINLGNNDPLTCDGTKCDYIDFGKKGIVRNNGSFVELSSLPNIPYGSTIEVKDDLKSATITYE